MAPKLTAARAAILVTIVAIAPAFACTQTNPQETPDSGAADADPPDAGAPSCNPTACASGHCGPDGACAPTCTTNGDCASGETCCNGAYCSDLSKDPRNCGACGNACSASQFCNGTSCFDAIVKNVCANARATEVFDSMDVDDDAGARVGSALAASCASLKLDSIAQGAPGTIDPSSGRPLTGPGDTYLAGGGGFGQKAIAYMNDSRDAPVFTVDDGTNASIVRSKDGTTVVTAPLTSLTAHHDYFIVYVATEPLSGTLVFTVYGLYAPGTAAGASWFETQAPSGLASMAKQYYVYEWTDKNGDGVANAGDTFTLLDAG